MSIIKIIAPINLKLYTALSKHISLIIKLCVLALLCTGHTSATPPTTSTPFTSTPFTSIVGDEVGGGGWRRDGVNAFEFGEEFLVDDILMELEEMGLRPPRTVCSGTCERQHVDWNIPRNDKLHSVQDHEGITSNSSANFTDLSVESSEEERTLESSVSISTDTPFLQSETTDDRQAKMKELVDRLSSLANIEVDDGAVDYHADVASDGGGNVSTSSGDAAEVADVLGPVKGERQSRLFWYYDRGSAFNVSVAFTVPLYAFTLPGGGEVSSSGMDGNVFGALAFTCLYLIGGLAIALYTTTKGAVGPEAPAETTTEAFDEARVLNDEIYVQQFLPPAAVHLLQDVSEALSLPTCAQLTVCEAYRSPQQHGALGKAVRMLVKLRSAIPLTSLTPLEVAARLAADGGDCTPRYSCAVDPLQLARLVQDSVKELFIS